MYKKKYNILTVFTKLSLYSSCSKEYISIRIQHNLKKTLYKTIKLSQQKKQKIKNFAINKHSVGFLGINNSISNSSKQFVKLDYLSQAKKTGFERVLYKTKKLSVDWHSNDLLTTTQGIWFYNCFQPFSTRKYWWILLPSQSLLFRLRWETLSKLNLFNKTQYQKWDSLKLWHLNWFNEKPIYIYWIIPFFGCLNLLSVSFSKNIVDTLPLIQTRKTYLNPSYNLNENKTAFSLSSEQPLNTTTFSWETLNSLSYKKNLLDMSFKFLKKITCYHDSIIYEVSPSCFNFLQEQYVGSYSENERYYNVLKNVNELQNKNFEKNIKFANRLKDNVINPEFSNQSKKKSRTFNDMQLWWNQESFEKNSYLRNVFQQLPESPKETTELRNYPLKNSLVEMISTPTQKTNQLSLCNSSTNEFVWTNFSIQKSKLKWCWYQLLMNNIPYKFNLPSFLWEKYVNNLDYKLNLDEKNLIQYPRTKHFLNNINVNNIFSRFLGFNKLDLLNLNFDEFAQKMFVRTTSIPLNYLSHSNFSNKKFVEQNNFDLYLARILKKSNSLKNPKKVTFELKKFIHPIFLKKNINFENNFLLDNVNRGNILLAIYSDKICPIQEIKKSFFSKFYSTNIKDKIASQDLSFLEKSTFSFNSLMTEPGSLNRWQNSSGPLSSITKNNQLAKFSFSLSNFKKKKEFFTNFKTSKIFLKNKEFYNTFGVLSHINQLGISKIFQYSNEKHLDYALKDYLKASFIYDNLFYKLFLDFQDYIFFSKTNSKYNTFQSKIKSNTFFKTTKEKSSDIFLIESQFNKNNSFIINLSKENLYKLKFPVIMSGYFFPETLTSSFFQPSFVNFLQQISLFTGFSPIKKIKRTNGFIKVTLPPSVLVCNQLEKLYFKKSDFIKKDFLMSNNLNINIRNVTKSDFHFFLPNSEVKINSKVYFKNSPFCFKVLNSDGVTYTKNYLVNNKSFIFHRIQKPIKPGFLDLTNNFMEKSNLKAITSELELKPEKFILNKPSLLGFRFKHIGNWSFYWNYFRNFYGSSNVLKSFNDIFYFTNFYPFVSHNFKKIGINQIFPGNNFLYQKWHPRKREGFFYKRINKLNVKNNKTFQLNKRLSLTTSTRQFNSIVELIWGFRAKYKLDEVLQYQKSKYYQSKKAQQTTTDQTDKQLTNNSKITLQTLTKSLIKRKRYKKYMRFEVLSEWLRDVLYFRQMSRKVFVTKKDLYLINISQLIEQSKRGRFNQKCTNLQNSFTKLFLFSNLGQIQSSKDTFASVTNKRFLSNQPISKLKLKYQKKRTINVSKSYLNEHSFVKGRKFHFYERWINNKKLLRLTKRIIPFKRMKLYQETFKNFYKNVYYNTYLKQQMFTSLDRKLFLNLKTGNSYNSSFLSKLNFKIVQEPLISTQDSYLNVFDTVGGSSSSNIKKLYLKNSNNRFLKVTEYNSLVLLIRQIKSVVLVGLKDLNNYLINIFKKFSKKMQSIAKIASLSYFGDKYVLNLKQNIFPQFESKLKTNSYFNAQRKKVQKSHNGFYFLNESSTQIYENSKKLVRILNSKPSNDAFLNEKNTKYIFKNDFINYFKTDIKNNWIKKVYKKTSLIEINNTNTKSFLLPTNKKSQKAKSQINPLTSILTKFKNFSSSFVLWRNKFQIRRDYLLLSYIYLDYIGALINSVINNCLDWIVEGTLFSEQNSKFVLLNNFMQNITKSKTKKIFPSSHEKFYLNSKLYKNNIIRPKWSFLIMNHLKSNHFAIYEKIVQIPNKEDANFAFIYKTKSSSPVLKFKENLKNLEDLMNIPEKKLNQKHIKNQIKQNLELNKSSSLNFLQETPSVVFYRSMVESYTPDLKDFYYLKSTDKNKSIPIMDSSINNNSYIKYKNQNFQKKIIFMKKQHKFQNFYGLVLRPLVNYDNYQKTDFKILNSFDHKIKNSELNLSNLIKIPSHNSLSVLQITKKSNLKVKLRRKMGVFKARILNKKTKIYNGMYLPSLQFANVSLLINTNDTFTNTNNQLKTKTSLSNFVEASFTLLTSKIKINNFWLCTIIFHVCLIFTLLTIYKSSIHFCIKSLYSTVFVLNKYFIYAKYRIQRLLKYIYQSNFQSIVENIQQKYSEKHIFSFYSTLNSIVNFFFKRNSAFSISSRFKKFNQLHLMSNLNEMEKTSFKSFSFILPFFNKTSNSKFIRFFHYLTQQNQNLKQVKKTNNNVLGNKNFSSLESFSQAFSLRSSLKKINYKFKLRNFKETETIENIGLNKIIQKSESKNLKFTFQVFRWNMLLTLLIGESEILAELEPYREMHWYFLKRFPVFLRTVAGKDSIGMVDYQADEKIRLIKQKIRQTIMILYLRSRKYESKLQNQNNINEKTNRSFLKNRTKVAKWSKDSRIQKGNKKNLTLEVSNTQSEITNNLEKLGKDLSLQTKKTIFDSLLRKISIKLLTKNINLFHFIKRKKSIRKISTWKSILTFLGKLSFISRYAKLNKRFRTSIMLFSNPLVFFGPVGTILIPYLIKSFFMVFESKSQFTQSFFNNVQENRNYFQKTQLNRKNHKVYELDFKQTGFLHPIETKTSLSYFKRNFFAKSLKSKLIKIYNLTTPFYQEDQLKPLSSALSEYSFEKHLGNLNIYIRQKMQNFEHFTETNKPLQTGSANNLSISVENFVPKFERDFLTNCLKFLNKYERIYISLSKINRLNKDNIKNTSFIEINFNPKRQTLFMFGSSKNVFQELGISNINNQKSRFINFDTFDPKLRYYRFYSNFSKVLSDVGGLRTELSAHQLLGPLICKVYAGLFLKQRTKNYLLVAGSKKSESLLFIVQALAGEMGMKLFLEDAKRLQRIGRRGINKATKRLEKLFDIAQANTPCLVFIEDIHVIGSKTKMIKVDEEQEDEEILVRSLLSKLIYRKYHKNKSLRETFIDQNLFTGGVSLQRRRSLKSTNPIPKDLVLYQLTRRRAFSNYFLNSNSKLMRINTKLFMVQKLSPAFTTNAVLIWKLFKSKIATPNKSIKEAPWIHIPVDALRSIHPLTYSIRVKIAKITLLAIFTMGTRLRLVKDLIRLFEKTHSESHKNFVVFATTTKLSYIDPSLRRPGRLEETIYLSSLTSVSTLVRASTFQSQLDNFKTYLTDLPGFSFTFNLIDNTIFSSRLGLREWSVINYLAEDAYQLDGFSFQNNSNHKLNFLPKNCSENITKLKKEFLEMSNNFSFIKNRNFLENIKEKWDNYQSLSQNQEINYFRDYILDSNSLKLTNLNTRLKNQRMTSYEVLNTGPTSDYWQMIFANIILQRKKGLFNVNTHKKQIFASLEPVFTNTNFENSQSLKKVSSATFFSTYKKNKSSIFALLAYTQVGQSLVSFLPAFPFFRSPEKEKKSIFFDPDQIMNLQLWPGILKSYEFKPQNILYNRRKTLNAYFLSFFSSKVGEFLFTNPIEWNNINSLENRMNYIRSFSKDGFLTSIHGIQPNWSLAYSYIMNLTTTSCLYSKSPLMTKLLRIEDVSKPRQKQFFESLNAGILFEYSDFHYRTFLKKNMVSMEENLNILQYQKFMLNNQGRSLRKYVKLSTTNRLWLFRVLFTELGSLNEISLRPTSMNYYYRNKIVLKQKLKLSSYQWLNWHLRKPLDQLEEIQDIAYFPCAEKYYNPRHRRWMITNGYWGYWFTFDKIFYQNLYQKNIFESFYKVYLHLNKNRELLDYLVQLLINQETISETELFLSFKRYSI